MKILALDTATSCCSCALSIDGEIVSKQTHIGENQHSQVILQQVETVLAQVKLRLKDLTAMAIDIGPGSFTGIRVGVGVCQGLAYAHKCPVITVNSLQTLAATVADGTVLALLDARMQQVYCALYQTQSHIPTEVHSPMVVAPTDIPFVIEPHYQLIGNGVSIYENELKKLGACRENTETQAQLLQMQSLPQAETVAQLAYHYGLERAIDAVDLSALYVRNKVTN